MTPFLNLSMRIAPLGTQLSPLQMEALMGLKLFPTAVHAPASIPGWLAEMPLAIMMYSREEVTTTAGGLHCPGSLSGSLTQDRTKQGCAPEARGELS